MAKARKSSKSSKKTERLSEAQLREDYIQAAMDVCDGIEEVCEEAEEEGIEVEPGMVAVLAARFMCESRERLRKTSKHSEELIDDNDIQLKIAEMDDDDIGEGK